MYGAPVSKDLNLQPAGVRTPPQMSSPGLLRYRSAPSTLLGEVCGDFLPGGGGGGGQLQQRPASPDHAADTVLARFLAGHGHPEIRDKPPRPSVAAAHFAPPEDAASMASQQQQLMYQSHHHQQQMASAMEGLYRTVSSGGTESTTAAPAAGNSLLRQSSSPAGFLNHLTMDNGYGNMLRACMGGGGDPRLKGQLSFSSRQGSVMSQISEMGSEDEELAGGGGSPEAGTNGAAARGGYGGGYTMGSSAWEEPSPPTSPVSLPWRSSPSTPWPRPRPPYPPPTTTPPPSPPTARSPPPHSPALASPPPPSRPRSLQFLKFTAGEATRRPREAKGSTIPMEMQGRVTRRRELALPGCSRRRRLRGRTSSTTARSPRSTSTRTSWNRLSEFSP